MYSIIMPVHKGALRRVGRFALILKQLNYTLYSLLEPHLSTCMSDMPIFSMAWPVTYIATVITE